MSIIRRRPDARDEWLVRRTAVRHRRDLQDYAESFRGPDHLARIQAKAQTIVSDAFKAAGV